MPKVVKWRKTMRDGDVKVTIDQIEISKARSDGKWIFKEETRRRNTRNQVQTEIRLFFPDLCLFGQHQVNVPASGVLRKRLLRSCPPDVYRFAAYFEKWRVYAVGHSSPIIVVTP